MASLLDEFAALCEEGVFESLTIWLEKVDVAERPALFGELLRLELFYRVKLGQTVEPSVYLDSFPEYASEVGKVFAEADPTATYEGGRRFGDSEFQLETLSSVGSGNNDQSLALEPDESPAIVKGTLIGPYRVLDTLGEGGMGTVFIAEQKQPVARRVALKVIKAAVGSKQVIARFEAERQAMAMMNHPNIARILDAGTTVDGQPYFAMELVHGKPITEYCDQNRLSIEDRLKLFCDVCAGVQHAHQKGIIHRDLKPSNILVAVVDGKAVPKVIDFGLAKAMESTQKLTDQSLFTGIGQVLGTLKYMSPEQAGLDTIDIDTRTDIYALGIILYELLTGQTPLDSDTIKGQAVLKVLEIIRERDPIKPSSRLGHSDADSLSSMTQLRRTDLKKIQRELTGDLDWIVMRALEKDRTRRYDSASGFADDVLRYLNNEPVEARPPSINYRVRKFVRKNRIGVIAASLVLFALTAGVVGTTVGMLQARTAQKLADSRFTQAEEARIEAETAKGVANTKRIEAEENLAFAKKANQILGSVFEGLDPKAEYETIADLRDALTANLTKAVKQLDETSIGSPVDVAEMQSTLGNSLLGLGSRELATLLFQHSIDIQSVHLGVAHPDTMSSMNNLACALDLAGNYKEAIPLYEKTLELRKKVLGPTHPDTLTSMNNLAFGYSSSDQMTEALPLYEQTLKLRQTELGDEHQDTISSMNNLAVAYNSISEFDKALPLLQRTLAFRNEELGPEHPSTLITMSNLAHTYKSLGKFDEALKLVDTTLQSMRTRLGSDHPVTITTLNNLAGLYKSSGDMLQASQLYERTLELRKTKLGVEHPDTLMSMNNLAGAYLSLGKMVKALELHEQTLELRKATLGPSHSDTLTSMNQVGFVNWKLRRFESSIPVFRELLGLEEKKLGRLHPETQSVLANLGVNYKDAGKLDAAIEAFEEAVDVGKVTWAKSQLLDAYLRNRDKEKYATLVEAELLAVRQAKPSSDALSQLLLKYGLGFVQLEAIDKAEPLLREHLKLQATEENDSWLTANTRSVLGGVLTKLKKNSEAEQFLLEGYSALKEQENSIPDQIRKSRLTDALDRLIEFYTIIEEPKMMEKWKKEKSQIETATDK